MTNKHLEHALWLYKETTDNKSEIARRIKNEYGLEESINAIRKRVARYIKQQESKGLLDEEKRDFFATSILAESTNLQFDSEGRISLSSKLLKHAKIKNSMLFVGQGQTFQIWEPTAFEKFKVTARKKANLNRANLKWEKHFNNNEGK